MKNLRHPNIVKLVGVCWDDSLLGLCMEYVGNGTLEEWLRICYGANHGDLTWSNNLLKTAAECAAGVNYLHTARYWDDEEEW
jgi:serine/threonine protein kinase